MSERHPERSLNPDFVHHQENKFLEYIKEIIFGIQDGMVSTLGALTGIAVGSNDYFTVLLAGLVIIAVESISMAIGSYMSVLSEKEVEERIIHEELLEIRKYRDEEQRELEHMYIRDGWPPQLAYTMAQTASADEKLMLTEMAHRELGVFPDKEIHPVRNAAVMFFSYMIGGVIPLLPYFFLPISLGVYVSISVTLLGLFLLGAGTTKFTKQNWIISGIRLLVFGGFALIAGFIIGHGAQALK